MTIGEATTGTLLQGKKKKTTDQSPHSSNYITMAPPLQLDAQHTPTTYNTIMATREEKNSILDADTSNSQ